MTTLSIQTFALASPVPVWEEVISPLKRMIAKIIVWVVIQWERLFATSLIFKANQLQVVRGDVNLSRAQECWLKLQESNPEGILFNREKITSRLEGGACTAMSLEFAHEYAKIRKECDRSRVILSRLRELGSVFARDAEEIRTRQMVFNTIEVVNPHLPQDHAINKVRAFVNFRGFAIAESSAERDIRMMGAEVDVQEMIENLSEGTYFVRILKPANNEKLEECGHSMIYVKEKEFGVFYDPNQGARRLFSNEHARVLFRSFKENLSLFKVSQARFYRLGTVS